MPSRKKHTESSGQLDFLDPLMIPAAAAEAAPAEAGAQAEAKVHAEAAPRSDPADPAPQEFANLNDHGYLLFYERIDK